MENVNFHPGLEEKKTYLIGDENRPSICQPNGHCFFCRRLITSSNGETFSLQNLCRFLKMYDAVQLGKLEKLQENMLLPVCNECLKHHTAFTDLYRELELVTFRLNSCIRNILERMEKANGNFRDDYKDESETIKIMRQETILKCQAKVRIMSHLPRVKLKRLHVGEISGNVQESLQQRKMLRTITENESTDSPSTSTTDNEQELKCPYFNCRAKFKDKLALRYHHLIYHPEHFFPNQVNSLTITYQQFQQILGDLLFQKFFEIDGAHSFCSICSKQFQSSSASFNLLHLKMHLVQVHHSTLEEELEGTLKDSNLNEELSLHRSSGFVCPCGVYMADDKQTRLLHESSHCGLTVEQSRIISPRTAPTFTQTKKKLLAKFAPFARKTPLVSSGARIPKDRVRTLRCPFSFCRALVAPAKGCADKHHGHFVNHHSAEYYFSGCQLDTVTQQQFQRLVYDVLFQEFVGGERNMCTVCSKKFHTSHPSLRFTSIKAHLVAMHLAELKERLLELQKNPYLQETLDRANSRGTFCDCGSYLPHQWHKSFHRENLCQLTSSLKLKPFKSVNDPGNLKSLKKKFLSFKRTKSGLKSSRTLAHYSCPYCLDQPTDLSKMEFHMIWHHCEHFFSNVREDYTFSISQEQFQRTVTDLLFKDYIVEDANASFGLRDTCTLCNDHIDATTSPWKVRYIKVHMLRNHKPELDEKLRNLLDKPNLAEILTECNPDGILCQCGTYLTNRLLEASHLKRHCKLKLGNTNTKSVPTGEVSLPNFVNVKIDLASSSFLAGESEEDVDPLNHYCSQNMERMMEDSNQMPLLFNNDFNSELHGSGDVDEIP